MRSPVPRQELVELVDGCSPNGNCRSLLRYLLDGARRPIAGSMRAFSVASEDRQPMRPEVPSLAETAVARARYALVRSVRAGGSAEPGLGTAAQRVCQGARRSAGGSPVRQYRRARARPVAGGDRSFD